MDFEWKDLMDSGAILCGKIIHENGIVRFERIDASQIDKIPQDQKAYVTASMGRAIFTIDENGKTHNFKGVDSHLKMSELGPAKLLNAKAMEYIPNNSQNQYKISAVVFNNKKPEIRINGTSPLEDIEIEGDINKKLASMGVKVPDIQYIREIPQDYSLKYGLPIKVKGNLDEFACDYTQEDNARKERLKRLYGKNYQQALDADQRPESMKEYLERIGFFNSTEIRKNVESLGYSIEEFVEAVDQSYARGQRYGQAERIMDSPFRISDLETCITNKNQDQLSAIMHFSEKRDKNFANHMASQFGKNIAVIMSNGWEFENLVHRQDFSLGGEFCDDSCFDIFEKQKELEEKYKNNHGMTKAMFQENKQKHIGQVMLIVSCIKVVQDAMRATGKNEKEVNTVLDSFVDSFTKHIDFKKMQEVFQKDENTLKKAFMQEFSSHQNWTEKMAGQFRSQGVIMDENIYNAHIENEMFYDNAAKMIAEKMKIKELGEQTPRTTISMKSVVSNAISKGIAREDIQQYDNMQIQNTPKQMKGDRDDE